MKSEKGYSDNNIQETKQKFLQEFKNEYVILNTLLNTSEGKALLDRIKRELQETPSMDITSNQLFRLQGRQDIYNMLLAYRDLHIDEFERNINILLTNNLEDKGV